MYRSVKRDRRPHEAWEPEPLHLPLDVPPSARRDPRPDDEPGSDERERPSGGHVIVINIG